ncbi:MAG: hypothetical protein A3F17_08125 [Gammaproteobacteria bacterium RIFCSPHIGHO2_12_FULL_41_15]|nr:MAG: hypothetical protein A3F17_08125 [Gammaproteobacteria bacterium RIFCSPHIGHO2_12_FULL_41_15]
MPSRRTLSRVGIELCRHQIRAVRLSWTTPETLHIHASSVVDAPSVVLDALIAIRQCLHYQNEATILGIHTEETIIKAISLEANLTSTEKMAYLQTQSMYLFGHAASELVIDFIPTVADQSPRESLLVVAAKRNYIDHLIQLCKAAGFRLRAIDSCAFSLQRVLPLLCKNDSLAERVILIELLPRALLFCAINNRQIIFTVEVDYAMTGDLPMEAILLSAFHRAWQLFQNAQPQQEKQLLLILGHPQWACVMADRIRADMHLVVEVATLKKIYLPSDSLDSRLFASLGLALWEASS